MYSFKKRYSILYLLGLFIGLYGCSDDFLNVPLEHTSPVTQFYNTDTDMIQALNSTYSSLGDINVYGVFYTLQKDLITNDQYSAESNTQFSEHYNFIFNPDPSASSHYLRFIWHSLYEGVYRANAFLNAEPTDITNPLLISRMSDEARFLRALYYFHIWTGWREFPLRTVANFKLISVPKSDRSAAFDLMVSDLKEVIENDLLPNRYSGSASDHEEAGRATMAAAKALLGKIYLFNENWDLAIPQLLDVANMTEYQLMQDFSHVWNIDYEGNDNSEIIYSVIFSRSAGQGDKNSYFSDGYTAGEESLRSLYILEYENLKPTKDLLERYFDEPNDQRRVSTILLSGEPYPWDPSNVQNDTTIIKGMSQPIPTGLLGTGEDFPVLRLADVYLMLAEAYYRSTNDENNVNALLYLDLIRERAYKPTYVPASDYMVASGKPLMEVIKEERRKELAFECHTYNDLRRWGDLNTIIDRNGNVRFKAGREFWPIPQGEINRSQGLIKQDPNY